MKTMTGLLAATAVSFILAMPALGQDRSANGSVGSSHAVAFGDLDLTSQAGIDTLYKRLRSAANRVCSPREDIRNLPMHRDWRQCMKGALDRAVSELNLPALTQTHQVASGYVMDDRVAGSR